MILFGNTTDRLSDKLLAGQIGSAWKLDLGSDQLIRQLAGWLDGQLSVTSQREQQATMRARSGSIEQSIWVPAGCLSVQYRQPGLLAVSGQIRHVGSVKIGDVWLDHGTDYSLRDGMLQLRPHATSLIQTDRTLSLIHI